MSHSLLLIVTLATSLGLNACSRSDGAPSAPESSSQPLGRIDMAVTADGFVPKQARVKVGQPVTLVVTRKVDRTCATDIVIKDYGVNKALPRDQPVEITFTPTKAGKIRFACAMDMVAGELVAE
jgi:plastocyanin domain-containing protein